MKPIEYTLMNKDIEVADFMANGSRADFWGKGLYFAVEDVHIKEKDLIPYYHTFSNMTIEEKLSEWLGNRCGGNHNYKVDEVMSFLSIDDARTFIEKTHAASLNDTFWVKEKGDNLKWENISLYRKDFNKKISDKCLGFDMKISKKEDSSRCPEFVTNGSFMRGFSKEDNGIYINKRNGYMGFESICEVLASDIMRYFTEDTVEYKLKEVIDPSNGKKEYLSSCKFFTDEKTGMIGYMNVADKMPGYDALEDILEFIKKMDCEDKFLRMALGDCFIFNTDRHLNNFGFLMDNDTLELKGFAPVYDMNLSLFPSMNIRDMDDFNRYSRGFSPRFGYDFTLMAHTILDKYPEYMELTDKMQDFRFTLSPKMEEFIENNESFSMDRIKFLEEIIHRQAKAVLKEDTLFYEAVYSEKTEEQILKEEYRLNLSKAKTFIRAMQINLENTEYADYDNISLYNDEENMEVAVIIDDPAMNGSVNVNFTAKSISSTGKQFPEDVMKIIHDRTDMWFDPERYFSQSNEKEDDKDI